MRQQLRYATGVDVRSVPVRRRTAAADHPRAVGAVAYADGDTVTLPGELGPVSAEPARSLLAHELTHVAQHRRGGDLGPDESSPAGQVLEREAASVQARVAALPLAASPLADSAPQRTAASGDRSASPRGAADRAPAPVRRAALDAGPEPVSASPEPLPAAPPSEPPAPAADGAEASGDSAEVEEQVRKLYRPLLAQLRRDLLVERERAGFLIDRR